MKLNLSMVVDTFEDRESYRAAAAHAQAGDRSDRRKRARESADPNVKLKRERPDPSVHAASAAPDAKSVPAASAARG